MNKNIKTPLSFSRVISKEKRTLILGDGLIYGKTIIRLHLFLDSINFKFLEHV